MKKTCMTLLACMLAVTMGVTAFAAELPQTVIDTEPGGTSITITDITPREENTDEQKEESRPKGYTVGSHYPVEIQTAEDHGFQLLVKTFVVPEGTDPQELIEEGLTRRGVEYQVSDILRRELDGSTDRKTISETVIIPAESDDEDELLALFDPEMAYSENGYTGTLTLKESSITAETTDTEGYAYTIKDVKEYTGLDRNDPYYIPKTAQKNGVTLELADVQWTAMASAAENSEVPSLFKATATYTGTGWGSKAKEYLVTAAYTGEVAKTSGGDVLYSIIYEEIPAALELPDVGSGALGSVDWGSVLTVIFGVILCGGLAVGAVFGIKWLLQKREENAAAREMNRAQHDPYAGRPAMDLPDMLDEMDRGLEDEY